MFANDGDVATTSTVLALYSEFTQQTLSLNLVSSIPNIQTFVDAARNAVGRSAGMSSRDGSRKQQAAAKSAILFGPKNELVPVRAPDYDADNSDLFKEAVQRSDLTEWVAGADTVDFSEFNSELDGIELQLPHVIVCAADQLFLLLDRDVHPRSQAYQYLAFCTITSHNHRTSSLAASASGAAPPAAPSNFDAGYDHDDAGLPGLFPSHPRPPKTRVCPRPTRVRVPSSQLCIAKALLRDNPTRGQIPPGSAGVRAHREAAFGGGQFAVSDRAAARCRDGPARHHHCEQRYPAVVMRGRAIVRSERGVGSARSYFDQRLLPDPIYEDFLPHCTFPLHAGDLLPDPYDKARDATTPTLPATPRSTSLIPIRTPTSHRRNQNPRRCLPRQTSAVPSTTTSKSQDTDPGKSPSSCQRREEGVGQAREEHAHPRWAVQAGGRRGGRRCPRSVPRRRTRPRAVAERRWEDHSGDSNCIAASKAGFRRDQI
ncbi:hypothetical protein C8R45DRAFT_1155290 [Mycena sanguinolenta]|nr:hypothetical protein C8R45DRAFT_1155290 [Mycena sanguinolenta]